MPKAESKTDPNAPVVRLLAAAELSRIDLASRAKVSLQLIGKLAHNGEEVYGLRIKTLIQIALAFGCAPAELLPELAQRPRVGLLWERGVFREPRGKQKKERVRRWYGEKPELAPEESSEAESEQPSSD